LKLIATNIGLWTALNPPCSVNNDYNYEETRQLTFN